MGPTLRARLLRTFLPAALILTVVYSWVNSTIISHAANPALVWALSGLLSFLVACAIVVRTAVVISGDLERAEAERDKAEEELRRERDLVGRIVEMTPTAVVVIDSEGRITFANTQAQETLGLKRQGALQDAHYNASYFRFVDYEGNPFPEKKLPFPHVVRSGQPVHGFRHAIELDDGRRILLSVNAAPLFDDAGQTVGMVAAVDDVTDQVRSERAIRESEERLRLITDNMVDMISQIDVQDRLLYVSPSHKRVLGYEPLEMLGRSVMEWMHLEDLDGAVEATLKAIASHSSTVRLEYRYRHADGEYLWMESQARLLYDRDGQFAGAIFGSRDISDRRRAEGALRESEERYRSLFERVPLGLYRTTPEGRILDANPALLEMLGYADRESLLAVNAADVFMDPTDRERELAPRDQSEVSQHETRLRRRDGKVIWVRDTFRVVRDGAGQVTCYEGSLEDITERKRLEEQLLQAQKMEAVGRLAGGIAHDFNNLLTVINGYSEILLSTLSPEDPMHADVEEIHRAGERAASLTRQLLAFSRRQVMEFRIIHLNALLTGLGKMLSRLIGEDIRLEFKLAPDLGSIRADPGQIEQVVMNLAVNARDAMPAGGTLTLETANIELNHGTVETYGELTPGPYVLLAISDTGIGMPPEVQQHLFEPFFTTKEVGKGTGLGLATVYGIVKQSGGDIQVQSEPGRGATFGILLPRVVEEAPVPAMVQGALPRGQETILVVEDQEEVRHLTVQVLQDLGYTMLEASNGKEALQVLQALPARVDLVLTDVIMPEMSGSELLAQLRLSWPNLRALYISGYPADELTHHGILGERVGFIQKPFGPEALAQGVRQALDNPGS
jgi:PAS domain S-box-containing protein